MALELSFDLIQSFVQPKLLLPREIRLNLHLGVSCPSHLGAELLLERSLHILTLQFLKRLSRGYFDVVHIVRLARVGHWEGSISDLSFKAVMVHLAVRVLHRDSSVLMTQ